MRWRHQAIRLFGGIALALASPAAAAQEANVDTLGVTFDAGFVTTSGNTDVTTLNGAERLRYKSPVWVLTQFLSAVYGETSGVESAGQYLAGARADRLLGRRLSAYALLGFERNRFAGIDRRFEEGVGLAFQLIAAARDALALEAGVTVNQDRDLAGATESFAAGRAAASVRHALSEAAYVEALGELLANLEDSDDVRANGEVALVAPLSGRVALKAAYRVRWDNQPAPGFKDTDRTFTTGVQIAIE
jgi:putative salt-induced outer membrane protein